MRILYTRPTQMLSPALQQSIAWHKEQTARVRAYQPQKPVLPGNWRTPGETCGDCVPPPPAKTQIRPQMPTRELFADAELNQNQKPLVTPAAAATTVVLSLVGLALFARLLN